MEESKPKTFAESISEYYTKAVHIVFGVILGQSFFNSASVLVPASNFVLNEKAFLKSYELILIYFIIVTSWIGYFKSTEKTVYSGGRLGIARFGTDFLILFLYYYLVILVTHESGTPGELFSNGLAAVFGAYLLWDILKYRELPEEQRKADNRTTGMITTLIWFGEFVAMALTYYAITHFYSPPLTDVQILYADSICTTIAIALVTWYRIVKWREPSGSIDEALGKTTSGD
ncbi:MAG TPA: hypothetical protein VIB07_00750 [Nitrososphaera sp.]|jgi:hypothetical protein